MYTAILLFGLGQGLLLENWLAGWGGLVTFAPMVVIRLPREEQMMVDVFGDTYREYMGRTGRLWPRWGRSRVP
jgi:protein-S-isoprenylcysteine O-methyltransferase Ste14